MADDYYGTVAEADTYFTDRGEATWTGTDAVKEEAMRRAAVFIDGQYRHQFPGYPAGGRDQALEWPRNWAADIYDYAIPSDEVPREVKEASYEAALRELVTPGSLLPDWDPGAQNKRVKVDVIEVERSAPYGAGSVLPVLTICNRILARVLSGAPLGGMFGKTARI